MKKKNEQSSGNAFAKDQTVGNPDVNYIYVALFNTCLQKCGIFPYFWSKEHLRDVSVNLR